MGFATAAAAAAAGADVVVASRSQENVDKALAGLPDGVEGYQLDASDEAAVRSFFDKIGPFDHLVFTAGQHIVFTPFAELTTQQAREWFDNRYWMAFTAAKHATGHLRPHGSITFTSGIAPVRPAPGVAVQAVAAGAIETLTRALAVELGPIRVNTVRVGPLERSLHDDPERAELFKAITAKIPTRRFGTWDEVGAAYLYLMQSGFTTGTVLQLEGGYVLV
jgi:NAD(P)-dependent dehydrogenase (short-subunit alcohol dehydrogenase family)